MGDEGSRKTEPIAPALPAGVAARFIVKGPNGIEKSYPMRQHVMTIGRSDECDIAVKDGSMSGRHCQVSRIGGEIKVRDVGSANGIWLNGERVEERELFDGDVLRLGQTSIRVEVAGGRKRPDGGLSPRLLAGITFGVVILALAGFALGMMMKRRAQQKFELATLGSFLAAAREGQESSPCAAAAETVADVAKRTSALGKPACANPPRGADARRVVTGFTELASTDERVAAAIAQFAAQWSGSTAALAESAAQIADPDLKARVVEAEELIERRSQVTRTLIADWRKLGQATSAYAGQLEQAFLQGRKGACAAVDRGIPARTAPEMTMACNKNFERARKAVEEKLKEIDDIAFGGTGEAAARKE